MLLYNNNMTEENSNIGVEVPDFDEVAQEVYEFRQDRLEQDISHDPAFKARTYVHESDPEKAFIRVPRNSTLEMVPEAGLVENPADLVQFVDQLDEWEAGTNAEPVNYGEHLGYFQDANQVLQESGIETATRLEAEIKAPSINEVLNNYEQNGLSAQIATEQERTEEGEYKFFEGLRYDASDNTFEPYASPTMGTVSEAEAAERQDELGAALEGTGLLKWPSELRNFSHNLFSMTDYEDLLEKGMEEVPDDAGSSERFELPVVDTRKEGSKTVITNFGDIADTINRDEDRFSKFLQNELGTAARVESSEMILNGELRRGNIQSKVKQFANEYVFCPECESPDTKIIKEKGIEILKCQACGARNPL